MDTQNLIKQEKKHFKSPLLQVALYGGLNAMLLVLQMWFLANVMNMLVFEGQSIAQVSTDLWFIVVIVIIRFFLNSYADKKALQIAHKVTYGLQCELLEKLNRLGPCASASIERGRLSTLMVEGTEKFGKMFSLYVPALFHVALIPICVLVVTVPTDLVSAFVFILTAPLIPLFMILIGKGAETINQQHWVSLTRLGARLQESIRAIQTIKLFGASQKETKRIEEASTDYKDQVMRILRIAFLSSVTLEFFSTISIALIAVFIGFRLLSGEMQFQDGFLILLLAPEFYQPLRSLGTNYHIKMEATAAADEIVKILNLDEPQSVDTLDTKDTFTPTPYLVLRDVSFTYPDGRQALSHVNLQIQKGETVVITGASGAGKSTLLHLVLGFLQPTSGQIYLNGKTLNQTGREEWDKEIAWLSQHPHLFDTTIASNVALDPHLQNEAQIKKVIQHVQLEDAVQNFPNKLAQRVGEQGRLLSGGEGRRLALARVLLKNAAFLIMDEPSANLDLETETLIFQQLEKLKKTHTLLIAAHREKTIKLADRVLHLENGIIRTKKVKEGAA